MRWQHGQHRIDELIADGKLERCDPSLLDARSFLSDALHFLHRLQSSGPIEPSLRRRLAYRAMAASAGAVLAAQGLRQTRAGGRAAVQQAVNAQFGGGRGPGVFDRLTALSMTGINPASIDAATEDADAAWAVKYATHLVDAGIMRRYREAE